MSNENGGTTLANESNRNPAKLLYDAWKEAYDKLKANLPDIGLELSVERVGIKPKLTYILDQDLLYAEATISQQIVNNDGSMCEPHWVLVGQDQTIRYALKIIISGATKNLYVSMSEDTLAAVNGVKICSHSSSRRSVIGELML